MLLSSLEELGAGRSILVDRKGNIIAGNKTAEAARSLKMKNVRVVQTKGDELVVVQRTDLDIGSKKARRLAIADNRIAEVDLEWDPDVLRSLKVDIPDFFTDAELRRLIGASDDDEGPAPQLDRAAELQQKWKTERGQIWEIGKHRLMCGDCIEDGAKFISSFKVDAVVTDPPYGVGVAYENFKDESVTVRALINKFAPLLNDFPVALLTPGIPAMWSYPKPDWLLAWVHPAPTSSGPWGFCGLNPILAYGRDPYLQNRKGRQPDVLVLATDRAGIQGHPTPKPVKVWNWLIERATHEKGQHVYDPFAGSGTSLVCCESLGRICYAMEIEPKYVAVALERMSDMGLKPKLARK